MTLSPVPGGSRRDVTTPGARRLGRWLGVGVAVLAVFHVVLHLAHDWFDALPANTGRWFDLNSESSVGTWFNVSLLVLVAAAAAVAAVAATERPARRAWAALACAVALLSLDEKISIHERLPELVGLERETLATHEWLVPGVALGLLGVAVLWRLGRALPAPVRRGLVVALALYVTGAVVVEGLTGFAIRGLPLEHPVRAAMPVWELVEECLEMLGCIVALMTVVSHLHRARAIPGAGHAPTPERPQPAETRR